MVVDVDVDVDGCSFLGYLMEKQDEGRVASLSVLSHEPTRHSSPQCASRLDHIVMSLPLTVCGAPWNSVGRTNNPNKAAPVLCAHPHPLTHVVMLFAQIQQTTGVEPSKAAEAHFTQVVVVPSAGACRCELSPASNQRQIDRPSRHAAMPQSLTTPSQTTAAISQLPQLPYCMRTANISRSTLTCRTEQPLGMLA